MKVLLLVAFLFALVFQAEGFGQLCGKEGRREKDGKFLVPPPTEMPSDLKVAFIGDAGSGSQQKEVLQMIKNWGAVGVIHSGDFEYSDNAALFEQNINAVLGDDYPYFASIGNHDVNVWSGSSGHQARLIARLERAGLTKNCEGDYGVNMACNWKGLFFVLSGVGTRGSSHSSYIDQTFSSYPAIWKFSSWHKNQRLMQIGGKSDETGWAVYDTTRKHGAIVVTGHEHSYCRSYMMSDMEKQVIANTNETLNMKIGESFVFVSGLAGKSIRSWSSSLYKNPWWASVAASNNGVSDGALLCTFKVGGHARKAHCTFKDRKGKTWDDFDIYSNNPDNWEDHLKEMAEYEAKNKQSCSKRWIEVPVTQSCDDVIEGEECTSPLVQLGGLKTTLTFREVPLQPGERIEHAYLQVYGASDDLEDGDYIIRGGFQERITRANALWKGDDEDWEKHSVWVSEDLKEVVSEIVNQPDWVEGSSLSLSIFGKVQKAFYSFDHSPCLSPTLAIELESC